jgi:hypothetical protein
MLRSLDVLIGLAVVMLTLSMTVTVLTQFLTTCANSRGRYLRRGLVDLLGQIDPRLGEVARPIATAILTNPLVSATARRLGSVVHREEFTKLLMSLAGDQAKGRLDDGVRGQLKEALKANGIDNPDAILESARAVALELERSQPALASDVRQARALLSTTQAPLVAKINGWFDQTMDRVSQRFTAHARAITFVGAVVVSVTFQVDTILIVNRLSADEALRAALVTAASTLPPPATTEAAAARPAVDLIARYGLISVPRDVGAWWTHWKDVNPFGVAVTALLLSLGAPFWYNALAKLLQLRSVLARKDDERRSSRQGVMTGDPLHP